MKKFLVTMVAMSTIGGTAHAQTDIGSNDLESIKASCLVGVNRLDKKEILKQEEQTIEVDLISMNDGTGRFNGKKIISFGIYGQSLSVSFAPGMSAEFPGKDLIVAAMELRKTSKDGKIAVLGVNLAASDDQDAGGFLVNKGIYAASVRVQNTELYTINANLDKPLSSLALVQQGLVEEGTVADAYATCSKK